MNLSMLELCDTIVFQHASIVNQCLVCVRHFLGYTAVVLTNPVDPYLPNSDLLFNNCFFRINYLASSTLALVISTQTTWLISTVNNGCFVFSNETPGDELCNELICRSLS